MSGFEMLNMCLDAKWYGFQTATEKVPFFKNWTKKHPKSRHLSVFLCQSKTEKRMKMSGFQIVRAFKTRHNKPGVIQSSNINITL